jgi:hypothetical protein
MKTTQITRHGKKVDFHDFTEDERDRALDKLDTIINMITSMLMSPTTKQNN